MEIEDPTDGWDWRFVICGFCAHRAIQSEDARVGKQEMLSSWIFETALTIPERPKIELERIVVGPNKCLAQCFFFIKRQTILPPRGRHGWHNLPPLELRDSYARFMYNIKSSYVITKKKKNKIIICLIYALRINICL